MKSKITAALVAAVAASSLVITDAAVAQTGGGGADAAVSAAITAVQTSVGTYAAALVGLAAIAVGFFVGIKYIKKIRGAA